MDFKAIIFDMDGTMLDTEGLGQTAWARAEADVGVDVPRELKLSMIGRTLPDIVRILHEGMPADFPCEALLDRANIHYNELVHLETPEIKPGLHELLHYLEEQDIPKIVATSSREFQADHKLGMTELKHRFSAVICGDHIEKGKPEPDIFLAAAEHLGCAAADCLVLEDSLPGVQAGARAGMRVIMIPELVAPDAETRSLAFAVVDSLADVIPILRQLGAP